MLVFHIDEKAESLLRGLLSCNSKDHFRPIPRRARSVFPVRFVAATRSRLKKLDRTCRDAMSLTDRLCYSPCHKHNETHRTLPAYSSCFYKAAQVRYTVLV